VHHLHFNRSGLPQYLVQRGFLGLLLLLMACLAAPDFAVAQASPFMTGATSLQTNLLAWLTPVAIILVMVLGGMAMANRMGLISGVEQLLDPCMGEIRWRAGDAHRTP
jgi:hypothetical protein